MGWLEVELVLVFYLIFILFLFSIVIFHLDLYLNLSKIVVIFYGRLRITFLYNRKRVNEPSSLSLNIFVGSPYVKAMLGILCVSY